MFKKFTGGMSLGVLALAFLAIVVLQIFTHEMEPVPTVLAYVATTVIVIGLIKIIKPEQK